MGLIEGVVEWGFTVFGIVMIVVMMLAREVGYRLGRSRSASAERPDEGVAVLVGGLLGLMSFVLAFNLSTSTTRLEDRRSTTLAEATAISTAWLQSRAVREVQGRAIADMLEEYLAARRTYAMARSASPENQAAVASTARLQAAIWAEMTTLLAQRSDPQTVSLANALTHAFDTTTAQTFAISTGLPPRLIWLLLISSALAISSLGYYLGLIGKPRLALSLVLALLWSGVMALILDLSMPRVGTVNTDLRPYDWTAEGFAAFGKPE